jgi:hypothetical protein
MSTRYVDSHDHGKARTTPAHPHPAPGDNGHPSVEAERSDSYEELDVLIELERDAEGEADA